MERLFHQYYDQEQPVHDRSSEIQSGTTESISKSKLENLPDHLKLETELTESLGPDKLLPDR